MDSVGGRTMVTARDVTWNSTQQFGKLMGKDENEHCIESSMESKCEWLSAPLRDKILNIRRVI